MLCLYAPSAYMRDALVLLICLGSNLAGTNVSRIALVRYKRVDLLGCHVYHISFAILHTMFYSKSLSFLAIAAVHSFTSALAAEQPSITQAPTPTVAKRQVAGGTGTPVLSTLHYDYTALPYQVYPYAVLRGPQFGFNQCNSTTLGPNSNCQTLIFNGPVRSHHSFFGRVLTYVIRMIFVSGDLQTRTVSLVTLKLKSSLTAQSHTTAPVSSPPALSLASKFVPRIFFYTI